MEPDPISSLVEQVDMGRLRAHVARLTNGERHSIYSPSSHAETVDYISTAFGEYGLATKQHTQSLGSRRVINIVGRKTGASPQGLRPLLVSAHYDTVPDSPGADDNASGVAALLECARVLSTAQMRRSIEFVAFDMEEIQPDGSALVGSTAFVKAAGGKGAYEGVYNLEMVGYTSGPGTQGHPPGFRFILPRVYNRARQRDFRGDFIGIVGRGPGLT